MPREPFYTVYISGGNIPRKRYKCLTEAIKDADHLAQSKRVNAFITEFTDQPVILCRYEPSGKMVQMTGGQ